MSLFDWLDTQIPKLRWYDISLTKLSVLFFTLMLVTAWPAFSAWAMSVAWYWHLVIALVLAMPVMKKICTK